MKKSKKQSHHFRAIHLLILILALFFMPVTAMATMGPGGSGGGGGGGGEPTAVNNLSFPAIAVDNFTISPLSAPTFTAPYTGDYPGLTAEDIAALELNVNTWYPQRTVGNEWQAQFTTQIAENVTYIDWGDNIESVNPKLRRPFRLEVTLYKDLRPSSMTGYRMAVLEYPSSTNELQGTNKATYPGDYATVVSSRPKLIIQYLGSEVPEDMAWNGTEWVSSSPLRVDPISFGPELNVGGKYVFGASQGGWKPTSAGYYRITFYIPTGSGINLAEAQIGDYGTAFTESTEGEGAAATPVVDSAKNLTYVDVLALPGGGGGKGRAKKY